MYIYIYIYIHNYRLLMLAIRTRGVSCLLWCMLFLCSVFVFVFLSFLLFSISVWPPGRNRFHKGWSKSRHHRRHHDYYVSAPTHLMGHTLYCIFTITVVTLFAGRGALLWAADRRGRNRFHQGWTGLCFQHLRLPFRPLLSLSWPITCRK